MDNRLIENIIFSNIRELILVVLYILKTFHPSDFFEKGGDPEFQKVGILGSRILDIILINPDIFA